MTTSIDICEAKRRLKEYLIISKNFIGEKKADQQRSK